MSYLGGFFLGMGYLSAPNVPIWASVYNSVSIYGNSTIDKVRIVKRCLSIEELDALTVNDVYSWDTDTLLLYAEFTNGDFNAGLISSDTEWTGYRVARVCCNDPLQKVLATNLPRNQKDFWDYTTAKDIEYTYVIAPITSDSVLTSFTSEPVTPTYEDVFLIDEITGEYFKFALNVEVGSLTTVHNEVVYDTGFSQYAPSSSDNQRYRKGSITALMGYMDGNTYIDNSRYLDQLDIFINNDNNKIIKGLKDSQVMKVRTGEFSHTPNRGVSPESTNVSFSIREVGAV